MVNKKCFFVIAPEGSGTYMMAEALVEAGCEYVGEEENLRHVLAKCPDDGHIVIRRSIPHRGEFLNLMSICEDIWWNIYDIVPVVMIREPNATIKSVQRRMPQEEIKVRHNMAVAWRHLGSLANNMSIQPIPYEALVHSPDFAKWLFETRFGLKYPAGYKFRDENRKYYE